MRIMGGTPARGVRLWLLAAIGTVSVSVLTEPSARADAANEAGAQARVEHRWQGTLTAVGDVVAVDLPSGTLVLDVPLSKGTLRVGATVPARTTFMVGARRASLQELRPGQRIRVLRRVPGGDEVVSGEILRRTAEVPRS